MSNANNTRTASKVGIHAPNGIHGWGIEFNAEPENRLDGDGREFVWACNRELVAKNPDWHHHTGWDSMGRGYQFYEYMGLNPDVHVPVMAKEIAAIIGTSVRE